jgi:UDP-3-O-[3-hydroxymyristoyl] glucosamine N-acyltransferase
MQLSEIADILKADQIGDVQVDITGVNTIRDATDSEICFLTSQKHLGQVSGSRAAAILVSEPLTDCPIPQLVVENADAGLIALLKLFAPELKGLSGIHPTAVVESTAEIDPTAVIGPGAYISHGVTIGGQTTIGANCSIGENTTIGQQCRLDNNVVVYHNCRIGNACVVQSNSTIGAVGFGYSLIDGQHRLIPHNGGVTLEDGVEIGANSCVDRAKFGNTIIGAGTKIDNLVQIAHNVRIGKLSLVAGQVGIAGSAEIGSGVVFAGAAGCSDHKSIGDGAIIAVRSVATEDIPAGETVLGTPPQEIRRELKCVALYQRLPELAKELKKLSKKVDKLESAKDN